VALFWQSSSVKQSCCSPVPQAPVTHVIAEVFMFWQHADGWSQKLLPQGIPCEPPPLLPLLLPLCDPLLEAFPDPDDELDEPEELPAPPPSGAVL
jgi:hypothetical protein